MEIWLKESVKTLNRLIPYPAICLKPYNNQAVRQTCKRCMQNNLMTFTMTSWIKKTKSFYKNWLSNHRVLKMIVIRFQSYQMNALKWSLLHLKLCLFLTLVSTLCVLYILSSGLFLITWMMKTPRSVSLLCKHVVHYTYLPLISCKLVLTLRE